MATPAKIVVPESVLDARVRDRVRRRIAELRADPRVREGGVVVVLAADVIGADMAERDRRTRQFSAFVQAIYHAHARGLSMPAITGAMQDVFVRIGEGTGLAMVEFPEVSHDLTHAWLRVADEQTQKVVFAQFRFGERLVTEMIVLVAMLGTNDIVRDLDTALAGRAGDTPVQHLHVASGSEQRRVEANWLVEEATSNPELRAVEEFELLRIAVDSGDAETRTIQRKLPPALNALSARQCILGPKFAAALLAKVSVVELFDSDGPYLLGQALQATRQLPQWTHLTLQDASNQSYSELLYRLERVPPEFGRLRVLKLIYSAKIDLDTLMTTYGPFLRSLLRTALPVLEELTLRVYPTEKAAAAALLDLLVDALRALQLRRGTTLARLVLMPREKYERAARAKLGAFVAQIDFE